MRVNRAFGGWPGGESRLIPSPIFHFTNRSPIILVKLDRIGADYCETVLNLPDMLEWTEAAKAEPVAVEELEAEF